MNKNLSSYFCYVLIFILIVGIFWALSVSKQRESDYKNQIKQSDLRIDSLKGIEQQYKDSLEYRDARIDTLNTTIATRSQRIIYKTKQNEVKNAVIDTLGVDSITKYIQSI